MWKENTKENKETLQERSHSLIYLLCFYFLQREQPRSFSSILEHGWHESESEVTQSSLTLCDPMDCSLPGSSVHGIFQARILEWVAISFSRRSSRPRIPNLGLPHCRQTLYHLSHQGSPMVGMGSSNLPVGRTRGCIIVQLLGRSDTLRPHGLHHARLPCPSPFPGACSNSCPLSR